MSTVHVELLSWLADTVDRENASKDTVLVQEIDDGNTVRDLLVRLADIYPRFGKSVFDVKDRKLSGMVAVFYNGQHIELVNGLETRLNQGDSLTLAPIIEGG
jgi:molybdopterin converting factor small subunit